MAAATRLHWQKAKGRFTQGGYRKKAEFIEDYEALKTALPDGEVALFVGAVPPNTSD